tara:strand:+ start:396 stop:521 length:126 start_codon:yes stop_codon:yes gene_type:complete
MSDKKELLHWFIHQSVRKYPNDQELGKAIRRYYLKEIKENE